jgi:hypothetical protein
MPEVTFEASRRRKISGSPQTSTGTSLEGTNPMTTPRMKTIALSTSYRLAKMACPPWLRTQINFPDDLERKTKPFPGDARPR